jgi:dephospho-CoA kinase
MHKMSSSWRLAVTGGIGSGKTNVCAQLRALGASTIDADTLGHRAYEVGTPGYNAIVKEFGQQIVLAADKSIDRKALGALVFGESNKLNMSKLTAIVWPLIAANLLAEVENLQREGSEIIIIEAAVMIEANWFDLVDELWVIQVPKDVAIQRVMKRNSLTAQEAASRIGSQLSNEARCEYADLIIDTNRPIGDTNALVRQHYEHLQARLKMFGGADNLRRSMHSSRKSFSKQ